MCGAPQSGFARLISPMSLRSSAETLGLPTGLRDLQRQYARNPVRCQRTTVAGLTIAIAARSEGNQRYSQTKSSRSVLLRRGRFGACRRSTLTCWRRTRFSASSLALDLKSDPRTWRISLNKSIIRSQAYPVCSLRPSRIEFSLHTGLRTGSPPSPPPRLIRPIVRLLPRSLLHCNVGLATYKVPHNLSEFHF